MKHTGGNAFPICIDLGQRVEWHAGMSLRDWFAGNAMQGLISQNEGTALISKVEQAAEYAYAMADAMIAERNKNDTTRSPAAG